jgi:hypothetical protein
LKIKPFSLGNLFATPGALQELTPERITEILQQHLKGDWGLCCVEDWHANDLATNQGSRILSVYWIDENDHGRGKVWCITEASDDAGRRACTTILLPDEY